MINKFQNFLNKFGKLINDNNLQIIEKFEFEIMFNLYN